MPSVILAIAAALIIWVTAPLSCLAQGAATPFEVRGVALAAEALGESALVRGAIERVLGPAAARTLLALPPKELGWQVIKNDFFAATVAKSPGIARAGNTEAFLASINNLRALQFQAAIQGTAQHTQPAEGFSLLGVNTAPDTHNMEEIIQSVRVREAIMSPNVPKRAFYITRDGIKSDPGYKIPIWNSANTTGSVQLEQLKWSDFAKGAAVACTITSPCRLGIATRVKEIVGAN